MTVACIVLFRRNHTIFTSRLCYSKYLLIWKLHVGNINYQLIYFRYFTISCYSCLNVWRIPNQFDRVIGALNHVTLDLTIYLCPPILCPYISVLTQRVLMVWWHPAVEIGSFHISQRSGSLSGCWGQSPWNHLALPPSVMIKSWNNKCRKHIAVCL